MADFVGLDVSLKEVSICVMDAEGEFVAGGRMRFDPSAIVSADMVGYA